VPDEQCLHCPALKAAVLTLQKLFKITVFSLIFKVFTKKTKK
jgi:hypothetical protein